MRTFALINELGQEYQLNKVATGFFRNPDGLGWSGSASYQRIGTRFERGEILTNQAKITGEIVFGTKSPYEAQAEFLRFIRSSKELLFKKTTPAGTFLRDVDLIDYGLTEIGEGNFLYCPITLVAKSNYYNVTIPTIVISGAEVTDQAVWPIELPATFQELTEGTASVNNDGSEDAALEITINGPAVNPSIVLTRDGEELARIDIPITVDLGERIEYSSRDGKLKCDNVSGGTRTNLTPLLSIENENFFKAPVGESLVTVTSDAELTSAVTLKVYKEYHVA